MYAHTRTLTRSHTHTLTHSPTRGLPALQVQLSFHLLADLLNCQRSHISNVDLAGINWSSNHNLTFHERCAACLPASLAPLLGKQLSLPLVQLHSLKFPLNTVFSSFPISCACMALSILFSLPDFLVPAWRGCLCSYTDMLIRPSPPVLSFAQWTH